MNQQPLSWLLHALLELLLERDQPSRSVLEAVYLSRTLRSDVLTFNRRSVAGMSTVYLLMFLCGVSTVTNEDFSFRLQFLWCEIKRKKEKADSLLSCPLWIVSWCTRFPVRRLQVICYYWMFMKYVRRPSIYRYWEPAFVINRLSSCKQLVRPTFSW